MNNQSTSAGDFAALALRPESQAAMSIGVVNSTKIDLADIVKALSSQITAVKDGSLHRAEEMLIAQAHTLDALFNNLLRTGLTNKTPLGESRLRLALRAQNQCRTTLDSLAAVKNPPASTFVRQANIAQGHQQVNNGVPPPGGPATTQGHSAFSQNELLTEAKHETLDRRRTDSAGQTDKDLEAVGQVDGPKDYTGQGAVFE